MSHSAPDQDPQAGGVSVAEKGAQSAGTKDVKRRDVDAFADEREELTALLYGRPKWLAELLRERGEEPDTWYVGPRGPNVVDLLQLDDEEFAKYMRLSEMIKYDEQRKEQHRLEALGLAVLPSVDDPSRIDAN
jgi:hypothetical protein